MKVLWNLLWEKFQEEKGEFFIRDMVVPRQAVGYSIPDPFEVLRVEGGVGIDEDIGTLLSHHCMEVLVFLYKVRFVQPCCC